MSAAIGGFLVGVVAGGALGVVVAGTDRTAPRVVVPDPSTDCATGRCRCGACGGTIGQCDKWCRHCGARLE